jgi:hypothetical protein
MPIIVVRKKPVTGRIFIKIAIFPPRAVAAYLRKSVSIEVRNPPWELDTRVTGSITRSDIVITNKNGMTDVKGTAIIMKIRAPMPLVSSVLADLEATDLRGLGRLSK